MVENSPAWFALHVKSRHEFVVQVDMLINGVEVYFPAVNIVEPMEGQENG